MRKLFRSIIGLMLASFKIIYVDELIVLFNYILKLRRILNILFIKSIIILFKFFFQVLIIILVMYKIYHFFETQFAKNICSRIKNLKLKIVFIIIIILFVKLFAIIFLKTFKKLYLLNKILINQMINFYSYF